MPKNSPNHSDLFLFVRNHPEKLFYRLNFDKREIEVRRSRKVKELVYEKALLSEKGDIHFMYGSCLDGSTLSYRFFFYSTKTNQYSLLSSTEAERTHFDCIYFKEFIFVIGGRDGHGEPLNLCMVFSAAMDSWKRISDLPSGLSHVCCFIYREKVHVLGFERWVFGMVLLRIYSLNQETGKWEAVGKGFMQMSLLTVHSIQIIHSPFPNQLRVLIRWKRLHSWPSVFLINILNQDVIADKTISFKEIRPEDYVFSDGETVKVLQIFNKRFLNCICFDLTKNKKESFDYLWTDDYLETDKLVSIPLTPTIEYEPGLTSCYKEVDYKKKRIIFGEHNDPFQMEIDCETEKVSVVPLPFGFVNLRSSFCRIGEDKFFSVSAVARSFIYDLRKRQIIFCPSLKEVGQYNSCIYHKDKVILVCGDSSQKSFSFDLKTHVWSEMAKLNHKRQFPLLLTFNNKIYVMSMLLNHDTYENHLETYNSAKKRWETLDRRILNRFLFKEYLSAGDKFFFFQNHRLLLNMISFFLSLEHMDCEEEWENNVGFPKCSHLRFPIKNERAIVMIVKRGFDWYHFEYNRKETHMDNRKGSIASYIRENVKEYLDGVNKTS